MKNAARVAHAVMRFLRALEQTSRTKKRDKIGLNELLLVVCSTKRKRVAMH